MPSTKKESSLKTVGELERQLAQDIRALHLSQLGYAPQKISCHLFGNQLAIVMEDSLLPIEQLFLCNSYEDLAISVRTTIDRLFHSPFIELIQNILGVNVRTILSNSCPKTRVTGVITMLEKIPSVRNPEAIPKTKLFKKRQARTREVQPKTTGVIA